MGHHHKVSIKYVIIIVDIICVISLSSITAWGVELRGKQTGILTINNSPYIVTNNIFVPSGKSLTIEPGVVLKFADYYSLKVNGTLIAYGSRSNRVVFTSASDNEFGITATPSQVIPTKKDWKGIEFSASSGTGSRLEHCIIRYCDKVVASKLANPTLMHVIIADCNVREFVVDGKKMAVQEYLETDYNRGSSAFSAPYTTSASESSKSHSSTRPVDQTTASLPLTQETYAEEEFTFGEIVVVTAAKQEQKITEAPAIITVFTQDQIEQMPVENLYEILSYIPGVTTIETYYGYTSVTFRGVLQTHYNNKSLLLLNGHPLYETIVGSYYLEEIPKNVIKRIEVVRGPGSVLYGTNAFAGVINIITKDTNDLDGLSIDVEGGSFSTMLGSFCYGKKSNDVDFFIGGSYKNSKGYQYVVDKDEEGRSGEPIYPDDKDAYENDYMNLYASIKYEGLTLQGVAFQNEKDKFGIIPTIISTGERQVNGYGLDVKYNKALTDKFSFSGFAWYDYFSKLERLEKYPPLFFIPGTNDTLPGNREFQEYAGSKIGGELQLNYEIGRTVSLLGGIVYEQTQSDPYIFYFHDSGEPDSSAIAYPNRHDSYDFSSYFQASWKLTPVIGVIGGIRHNKNRDFGAVVTPRAGIIFNFQNRFYLKTLYGQAFRSPNFFEKYVQTKNVLNGDATLSPEEVNTLDISAEFLSEKIKFSLNYFYLTTDNMITRSAIADSGTYGHTKPTPMYGNSKGQEIQGVETEFSGYPSSRFDFFINLSYKTGIEKGSNEDIGFLANIIANTGINWKLNSKLSLGGYLQYVSGREGKLSNNSTITVDPFTLANFKLSYKLSDATEISLICKNALNVEYQYPEYIRKRVEYIPGGPQRAYYLKVQTKL